MNTEKVLVQKLVAMLIVFVMVISNLGIIGGEVIAYAETVKTSNSNVELVAYFEDADGNMLDEIESYIGETLTLKIDVTVKNDNGLGGYFDGTINIEESNFELIDDSEISVYVEAGYSKTIEREIEYQSSDSVTAEYLAKSSKISLTGTYTNSKKDYDIEGETSIAVSWKTSEETTSVLKASVLTNKDYTIGEETKRLVQVYINSKLSDNKALANTTEITITVPEGAEEVTVHRRTTGTDTLENLTYSYDSENNLLTINSNSNGSSDLIVVTYKYAEGTEISDTLNLTNKITTYDGAERTAETTVEISDEKDGVVSTDISQGESSIYKGKLYTGEDRTYSTTTKINVDLAEATSSIDVKENAVKYVVETDDGEEEKTASITYVKTTINKDEFLSLFGEDGYITIKDQDGNTVANITNESETNDDGDIEITYSSVTSIEIITSTPQREGILEINHEKKIAESKYSRDEIEELTAIKESNKTINEDSETANTKSSEIELKETESSANIKLEDSTISTTEDGQSLIIRATLDTSDESKDLYKNPTVKITLPEGITSIEIEQSKALYRNGLTINKCEISKDDSYELYIEFDGEQETYDTNGGLQIYININIEVDKTTTTHSDEIKMTYTNENKDVTKTATASVEFESKYGLMLYNVVSNYSENGETVEIINDEETTLELDTDSDSREMKIKTYLVNNHDKAIQDVTYIGTIPSENDNNTFTATLSSVKANNENIKIYYSTNVDATEDDESWTEDSTDAVAYKLVIDEMEAKDTIEVTTKINLPENLSTNQEGEISETVTYLYNEVEQTRSAKIDLMTEYELVVASASSLTNGTETEVSEGLTVTVNAVSANEELSDGDSIYEGQTVKYYITIANNTEEAATISASVAQTNGKVWGIETRNEYNLTYGEYYDYEYYVKLDSSELELTSGESINSGESITLEYEAYANTLENCDGTMMYGTLNINTHIEAGVISTDVKTIENEIKDTEVILTCLETSNQNVYVQYSEKTINAELDITNNSENTLTNAEVTLVFSGEITDVTNIDIIYEEDEETGITYTVTNTEVNSSGESLVTIQISEIEAGETVCFDLTPICEEMETGTDTEDIYIYAFTTLNENTYYSNIMEITVYQLRNDISIVQEAKVNEDEVTSDTVVADGSTVEFIATIVNNESESINIEVTDYLNTGLEVKEASITQNDETTDIKDSIDEDGYLDLTGEISADSTITINITVLTSTNELTSTEIVNTFTLYDLDTGIPYEATINLSTDKQADNSNNSSSDDESSDNEESDTTDENENTDNDNDSSQETTYSISGTAWIDSNEDGERDSDENTISGMTVRVIDVSTGDVMDTTTTTGSDGTYSLSLSEGTYIVLFLYDTSEYNITTYQANGVDSSVNSDAISNNVYISDETITAGSTDELTLSSNLINIDIGLIEKEEANLSIAKYVSKIVVTNSAGTTTTYEQDEEETLAKVEIGSKVLSGSSVTVEYTIEVTNLGDGTGNLGIIEDYLPSELSFSTSLNSDWYQSGENIYNNTLANEDLAPGETESVTLILTKTMTSSNTGLINNIAGLLDDDGKTEISTASADIIIGVKTGAAVAYVTITLVVVIAIFVIAYFINKKIMINKFEIKTEKQDENEN